MAQTPLSIPAHATVPPVPRNLEVRAFFYSNAVIGDDGLRFRQIDRYEAHYHGRQYAHLSYDWWGTNADAAETISPAVQVPLGWEQPMMGLSVRAKRPTAPFNLSKAVVDRFTGLLFSEVRRPRIQVEGDQDTEAFLLAVMEHSLFWAKVRQARSMGGATGGVMVTVGLRNGEFSLDVHNPKHITILWRDKRRLIPEAVLKMYTFTRTEDIIDERTRQRKGTQEVPYLYRRIISEQEDVVFKPVRLDASGAPPQDLRWEPESQVTHNLGFFPGVWVQNLPVLEEYDGDPDCQGGWQLLDTIDRIVSQINKGVLLNLDPTLVLAYDPKMVNASGGIRKGSDNALTMGLGGTADYLEISGTGVEAGIKTMGILKQAFLDVVRCVMIDPQTISGSAQSAKAIELIYGPMLEKADDLRAQWGSLCVVPLLKTIEKIARTLMDNQPMTEDGQVVPYKFVLPKRIVEGEDGKPMYVDQRLGPGGYIQCKWGPYFAPTELDDKQRIENAVGAKAGGLVDHLGAIKHVSQIFGISNPTEVKRVVDDELDQEASRAAAGMGAGVPFDDGPPPGADAGDAPEQGRQDGNQPGPPAGAGGKP